jgi:hypothetical protein
MEIMLRYVSILVLLIVFNFNSKAQSGYLGKKHYLKYSLVAAPGYFNAGYNSVRSTPKINTVHHLDFGRVISRNRALEISVGISRTSFKINNYSSEIDFGNQYNLELVDEESNLPLSEPKLYSYWYQFRYIAYARQGINLAPLGVYSAYTVSYVRSLVGEKYDEKDVYFFDQLSSYMFSYHIGNRRVMFNNLLVDFSVGSTLNLSIISSALQGSTYSSEVQERLLGYTFLNFRLGVGLLR